MAARRSVKQGKASLIGGFAVGFAVLVLWTAIAHELRVDTVPALIAGVLVAAGVGSWIRVADL